MQNSQENHKISRKKHRPQVKMISLWKSGGEYIANFSLSKNYILVGKLLTVCEELVGYY